MVVPFILRGFRHLLRPSGRDTPQQFWPFALAIFLGGTAIAMVPAMLIMVPVMVQFQTFALAHPDQADITTGPGTMQVTIHGPLPPEMAIDMSGFIGLSAVQAGVSVLLLAAAVAAAA